LPYILNLTVLPAVFEELAFRGILMQSLRRFGDGFALICSSLVFAFAHRSLVLMPNAFLMGLVIGYFVLFSGSLRMGIAIHLAHNLVIFLLTTLGSAGARPYLLVLCAAQLAFLAVGVFAFASLLKAHRSLCVLCPSPTVSSETQKLRSFFLNMPMLLLFVLLIALNAGMISS
jgi:hypothetical protein